MNVDPVDIISCEVCGLTHRRGAGTCEECHHPLGTEPNWPKLEGERRRARVDAVVGISAAVLLAVSMTWLAGKVWLLLVVPIAAWGINHARRAYAIGNSLQRRAPPQRG